MMLGQIPRFLDSVRKTVFIVGTALLIFVCARNSITWLVVLYTQNVLQFCVMLKAFLCKFAIFLFCFKLLVGFL